MGRLIFSRYALFSLIGVEGLLLPALLSPNEYASVEYFKFTVFLMQFGLLGVGTGYIKLMMESRDLQTRGLLVSNFNLVVVLLSIVGFLFFSSFFNLLLGVFFVVGIVSIALESKAKLLEQYLLAMSFRPILSVLLVAGAFVVYQLNVDNLDEIKLDYFFVCALLLALALQLFLFLLRNKRAKSKAYFDVRELIFSIRRMINAGFVLNLTTLMLFYYLFEDRTTIKNLYPEMLPTYSLGFVISQLALTAVTTFSYINLVEFGKESQSSESLYRKLLVTFKRTLMVFFVFGGGAILVAYFADIYYGYPGLFETSILMISLFGLATVFMSTNSVYVYLGETKVLFVIFFLTFAVSKVIDFILMNNFKYDYWHMLFVSYLVLLAGCVAAFLMGVYFLKKGINS